jgi:hypothetical protein
LSTSNDRWQSFILYRKDCKYFHHHILQNYARIAFRLLIKLTPHRIVVTVISIAFILAKGIAAYRRLASISITLDIVFGLLSLEYVTLHHSGMSNADGITTRLWWIGFYDQVDRAVWRWWFHTDHSRRVLDFTASGAFFH